MVTINVFLQVRPEKRAAYIAFVTELVTASQQDEGCLSYDHFENVSQQNQFVIVENWQDRLMVDRHNETPHLKKFLSEISLYLEKEPTIKISYSE
ncbi:putative quinol monooxygenase [Candidatus Enterococcus ikei]|uniref:Antibiotic biosynthesis monooxygenase n=1 Tax=Candidatus Enterococcus ikei TaxID=2815326 RepID=A0ABS3GVF8_9ENTE|nr:putative quinol monooxygenase [Enterococcus sp. DIV0869a]MBO0439241.1 antibiotic biosynthesis monooxygenase [Enterococcus sp. DIV0869a]